MALDDKFFKSPIPDELANRINRRKKQKKRPKPWDTPESSAHSKTPSSEAVSSSPGGKVAESISTPKSVKELLREQPEKSVKSVTNAKQMRNDSVTESETNAKQDNSDSVTNAKQMRNSNGDLKLAQDEKSVTSVTNAKQMRNDSVAESETKPVTIVKQTPVLSATEIIFGLSEKEYLILKTITKICLEEGALTTPKLTYGLLGAKACCSSDTARVLVYRSIKKGIYTKTFSKPGRAGFIILSVPQNIYHSVLRNENNFIGDANAKQTRNDSVTESVTESVTKTPTSTTYKDIYKSSSKVEETKGFPDEWKKIEIPQILESKGFHRGHIKQIYESKMKYASDREDITSESVQESFYHFAYDLEHGHCKPTGSLVRYFMKVLRSQGINWISEAIIAAEALHFEKLKKLAQEKKERKKEEARMQIQIKVENICSSLSDVEKIKLVKPKAGLFEVGSAPYEHLLFSEVEKIVMEKGVGYFDNKVRAEEFKDQIINLNAEL